jgi:hypothetical protein
MEKQNILPTLPNIIERHKKLITESKKLIAENPNLTEPEARKIISSQTNNK